MRIKKIILKNFRNYYSINLNLYSGINIFYGKNGQGKTNLLESIYFLAFTKSHRNFISENLIRNNEKSLTVSGIVKKNNKLDSELKIVLTPLQKDIYKDGKKINKISDYISNINLIIFSPDDLEIIKGSPKVRRNFLDNELSQFDHNYYILINQYKKLLKMRNECIKAINNHKELDETYFEVATNYLIEKAIEIYKIRFRFINKINEYCSEIYKNISDLNDFKIEYISDLNCNFEDSLSIKDSLYNLYKNNRNYEVNNCMTMYGPHKDDIVFSLNGKDLKLYGSQGQQRVAVLSLKLSEIEIFKKYLGEKPILLLDDIFSELDNNKKNKLLKYINNDIQIIITTTDLYNLDKKIIKKSKLFNIDNGEIVKVNEVKDDE